ncbi:hypothetical protein C4D60_Mb01t17340 [Musa balbisiana]|uniref:Uncharacterized protein n=1 Tax=Musa balbisiana TaxID=52838 RepID=A0A4S8JQ65_MUSBA|nr:hypothetical protein C4D60_Mb01t17340 [Musa balbisiana]
MLEGIIATSYFPGDKLYIDPAKLLSLNVFLTPYARTPAFDPLKPDGRQRGTSAQFAAAGMRLRGAAVSGSGAGAAVAAVAGVAGSAAVAAPGDGEVVTTKALPPKFLRYTSLIPDLDRFGSADLTLDGRSLHSCTVVKGTPSRSSRMKYTLLKCPDILAEQDLDWEVFLDQNVGGDNCDFVLSWRQVIYRPCKAVVIERFLPKPKYDNSSLFSFCCLLTTTLLSQHVNVAMISSYAAFHELNIEFYFTV